MKPMTKSVFEKSPVRVFERALGGGLGRGNFGVVLSRTGVGKTSFLIGLALDKLLRGERVLHISTQETVEHLREYYDELLGTVARELGLDRMLERKLDVERRRHILIYDRKTFTLEKLSQSAAFLEEAAGFRPDMVIMDGTPRFEHTEPWEFDGVMSLVREWNAEVWTASSLHREGQELDARGVPVEVTRFDEDIAVILALVPESGCVRVKILKEHACAVPATVPLELDPNTKLLRWR